MVMAIAEQRSVSDLINGTSEISAYTQSTYLLELYDAAGVKRSKVMLSEELEALSGSATDGGSEDEDAASDVEIPGPPDGSQRRPQPAPAAAAGKVWLSGWHAFLACLAA